MKRIQRKRTRGWKKPDNAVYIGRPSKWQNPYPITEKTLKGRLLSLSCYRKYLEESNLDISELKGKDLMCWCPLTLPCHGDILIEKIKY